MSSQVEANLKIASPPPPRKWSLQELEEELRGTLIYYLEQRDENEGIRSLKNGLIDYDDFHGPVPRDVLDRVSHALGIFMEVFDASLKRASNFSSFRVVEEEDEIPF